MDIQILSQEEQALYYDEILEMLYAADKDFVPPLSARSSTTQSDLASSSQNDDGVQLYFNEMKKQRFMVAVEDEKLLAFVSFKENYTNTAIDENLLPNIYISTLIVKPEARGKHLTQTMYDILFKAFSDRNILTRTWSANTAHIRILSKFNFETLSILENDRGQGIDTIYFIKRPT